MKLICVVLILFMSSWVFSQDDIQKESTVASNSNSTVSIQQDNLAPESEKEALFRLKDDVQASSKTSLASNAGTMLAGLVAVLVLIAALAWASKRLNLNLPGASNQLKLVSAMSVGPKEKVMLIEAEGNKLLIGVTSQHISLLKQIDVEEKPILENDFSQKMQSLLKSGGTQDA